MHARRRSARCERSSDVTPRCLLPAHLVVRHPIITAAPHLAIVCLAMVRDMHTVEPQAGDVGLFCRRQRLLARSYGATSTREIRWEVELQGHAPELPIVQQVRIGPVAAACFGPRQAIQFAAEDAQLLSHIPWATLQSLFEDSHERVEVGRVDRPLELDATTLQ